MLKGKVNRHGEPLVAISLILRQRPVRFSAVLDTGFNGYLSVPGHVLTRSRWQLIGTETYEIATGALVAQEVYLGEIIEVRGLNAEKKARGWRLQAGGESKQRGEIGERRYKGRS